jgi:acetyl esterase
MPLHPQTATLLELMTAAGAPALHEQTPDEARAARAALLRASTEPIHEVRDIDAGGVPARLYRPNADTGLGLLVYVHGGGWVIGDLDGHDDVCRRLANLAGVVVLSVDYRLAPEHPFPAGLGDCIQATRWAHAHALELGADPDRLAIGGDSAGANLATVVAQLAPVPLRFQLLVYPVADARRTTPSYDENAEGYFLTRDAMEWFVRHYLSGGHGSETDPRVSPLLADEATLARCPPTLVITAEYDPLRDEGEWYAHALQSCGVPTTLVRWFGQIHGFFSMAGLVDDAHGAHAVAADALRRSLA